MIESMFSHREFEQLNGVQDSHAEDHSDRLQSLIMRLLNQIKVIAPMTEAQIRSLSLSKLDALSESLFNFNESADLSLWLRENG